MAPKQRAFGVRLRHERRHRSIRREHELFHQVVRLARDVRERAIRIAVVIHIERQFRLIEAHGATLESASAHPASGDGEPPDGVRHLARVPSPGPARGGDAYGSVRVRRRRLEFVRARSPRVARLDDALRGGVIELGARSDDPPSEPLVEHLPVPGHGPLDAERQPLRPRVERTQILAQKPRKHGHDPLHEVRARTAQARLVVQGCARSDEVRHVRDVHPDDEGPVLARLAV